VILVVTASATAAVPDALNPPTDRPEPPGFVDLRETTVATSDVSGSTVTLDLTSYLVHERGTADDVTVVYRAVDSDTGFVATEHRVDVGDVARDGEHEVTGTVTVERQGGYRLLTLVYVNGTRVETGQTEVRGVGTLVPAYAQTRVAFHQFEGSDLPAVEYRVQDVQDNTTTMQVTTYLTNRGSTESEDLRLVLTARQAESNIVADRTTVEVGQIQPGRTATPTATLDVPSEYNYYLDAVLWKDGVIVATTRSAANLDPTETISVNQTTRDVGLEVSDFESDDGTDAGAPQQTETRTEGATPGFTAIGGILALLGAALLARRWSA
jgi:PGF-CTERM protein